MLYVAAPGMYMPTSATLDKRPCVYLLAGDEAARLVGGMVADVCHGGTAVQARLSFVSGACLLRGQYLG